MRALAYVAAADLDRMHGTEGDVDRLRIVFSRFHALKRVHQRLKQLLALYEERVADFLHRV